MRHDPERFLQRFETISLAGAQVPSLASGSLSPDPLHACNQAQVEAAQVDLRHCRNPWTPGLDWQYVLREADDLGLKRMLSVGMLLAEDPLEVAAPAELLQGLKKDRTAQALAVQVRRSLFEQPDKDWYREAEHQFQLEIRERLQDRARMFFSYWWPRIARRFVTVPDWYAD